MAFNVTQQINTGGDELRMLRSPLMVVLQEGDPLIYEEETFRYAVKVYSWVGNIALVPATPTAILISTPDITNRGSFDISQVLKDVFQPNQPDPTETGNNQTAGITWVQLEYGYYLNGSFNLEDTGDIFLAVDGYAIQQQPINEYESITEITNAGHFLASYENVEVTRQYPAYLNAYRYAQNADREFYYEDDQGNNYTITFPVAAPTSTTQAIYRVPIGLDAVVSISGSVLDPQKWVKVSLRVTSTSEVLSTVLVNYHDKSFCDVQDDCIAYVNRYGVWDYIHFKGRFTQAVNQSRTNYERRITSYNGISQLSYTAGASQAGVTDVAGEKRVTVRTGYVREWINDKIQDLMLSKVHYSFALEQNLKLDTGSIEFLDDTNSDLIEYTMEFSLAGNLIQNIK